MESYSIKTIQDIVSIVTTDNVEEFISDFSDTLREIARLKEIDPKKYEGMNHEEIHWTPKTKVLIVYSMGEENRLKNTPIITRLMNAKIPGIIITRCELIDDYGEVVRADMDLLEEYYQPTK
mgnify:CR=1 FL=1